MTKHNQDGAVNGLLVSLVLVLMLLVGAIGFGYWSYTQMVDYRDNVDQKVQVAQGAAVKIALEERDKLHAEQDKSPIKMYNGPSSYGSLAVSFPKTWSGYVDDTGSGSGLVDGYFNAGVVPAKDNSKSVFALRVQVVQTPYESIVKSFDSQQKAGKLKVSAYALPKLPKIVGVRVTGTLSNNKNVDMVVLPLRSQSLKIWTEGSQGTADFNKYILPNFSFSP